jgi:hypothetical protein
LRARLPGEGLAAAPAPARGASLRYQFKEGDTLKYVVEKKTETHSSTPGYERVVVSTRTYDVTWKVTRVDADGNARMTLTVDRVQYVEDDGFPGKVEFDSRKDKNPTGMPALVRVLSAVLQAQSGAPFTCTMSPRGEVSDFKVPKKLADAVKNTAGLHALYSPESFRQLLACRGGVVLPEDAVHPDASWHDKTEAP